MLIDEKKITMHVGERREIKANVSPKDVSVHHVYWEVDDRNIANVIGDDTPPYRTAMVVAKKAGETKVTVRVVERLACRDHYDSCLVEVKPNYNEFWNVFDYSKFNYDKLNRVGKLEKRTNAKQYKVGVGFDISQPEYNKIIAILDNENTGGIYNPYTHEQCMAIWAGIVSSLLNCYEGGYQIVYKGTPGIELPWKDKHYKYDDNFIGLIECICLPYVRSHGNYSRNERLVMIEAVANGDFSQLLVPTQYENMKAVLDFVLAGNRVFNKEMMGWWGDWENRKTYFNDGYKYAT